MKQKLRLGDCYVLTKLKPNKLKIRYISLWAVMIIMCAGAVQQVSAQKAEPAATAISDIKPLQIGETIPEYLWHLPLQVVNHPKGKDTITLNDYRDKLIILDFWATWCKPCIRSLHHLDTLQNQLPSDIVVIPSTYETAEKAAALFVKQGISLPSAVSERFLKPYFPHRSVPHQVWIKNNVLRAITHSEDATTVNIVKMLESDNFTLHTKKDVLDYNRLESISTYAERVGSPVLLSSILTGHIEGVPASVARTKADGAPVVSYTNVPVLMMYHRTLKIPNNRIILCSENEGKYIYVSGNHHQVYAYQLKLHTKIPDALVKNRIIDDLNFHFQLHVDSQVMDMDCYVISDTEEGTATRKPKMTAISAQEYGLGSFTRLLNNFIIWKPNLPLYINESAYSGTVKLTTESVKSIKENPDEVKKALEAHGLTLKKEKRPMLVYIISERKAI